MQRGKERRRSPCDDVGTSVRWRCQLSRKRTSARRFMLDAFIKTSAVTELLRAHTENCGKNGADLL